MIRKLTIYRYTAISFIFVAGLSIAIFQNFIGVILAVLSIGITFFFRYKYRCWHCHRLFDLRLSLSDFCPYCGIDLTEDPSE